MPLLKLKNQEKKSPDRINVELRQWVQTGLASLAHIKYMTSSLILKRNQVVNLLHKADLDKIGLVRLYLVQKKTGYRNKAQVPVRKVHGKLDIGFFRKHSHDLVPLTNFLPLIQRLTDFN